MVGEPANPIKMTMSLIMNKLSVGVDSVKKALKEN
jgi:hypothetical protein